MVTTSVGSLTGVFMRACWGAWCSYPLAKLAAFSPLTPALVEDARRETTMRVLVLFRNSS